MPAEFAGTVALTGDYTPQRLRAMMIMLTFTGAPLGGFVGGLLVSGLLAEGFAWPIIFVIGGVFPLILLGSQRYGSLNRHAFSRRVRTSHPTTTRCCIGSPSRRGPKRRMRLTSPEAIRSRCCSEKGMRCRRRSCGSASSAAS